MKAQEIAKYLAYVDTDEEYVVIKRKDLNKIKALAKKYLEIKKIMLDRFQWI